MSQHMGGVRLRGLSIALLTTGAIGWTDAVWAQNITLDGTLGPQRTLTGPVYQIRQEDGRVVDSNLFHSFGRFNLLTGERANFASSAAIRNILARVTGGARSEIDGLIFTNSSAVNLFLINPSGILFGPNARLQVGGSERGSFVATTTDALVWPDGSQFNARTPNDGDSLLRIVGDPSGFLAARRNLRPIEVRGSATQRTTLGVYPGQSLVMLGGEIELETSQITAPGGRVELGAVAGTGQVGLNVRGNSLQLAFPNGILRGDISLNNQSGINVVAGGGGDVAIYGRNISLANSSTITTGINPGLGSADSQAGDISLDATGKIRLFNSSNILNILVGTGNSGQVRLSGRSIELVNGSIVGSASVGQGNAGDVTLLANDSITFSGRNSAGSPSGIFSALGSILGFSGNGKGGNIFLKAPIIDLRDGAQVDTANITVPGNTAARGNAGNIRIEADRLTMTDRAGITTGTTGIGNAGNIDVETQVLEASNGSSLIASTSGQGNAGNIIITARDHILFDGGGGAFSTVNTGSQASLTFVNAGLGGLGSFSGGLGSFSTVNTGARGKGGNIEVNTGSLTLTDGAQLSASTVGEGKAGNVIITTRDRALFRGTSADGQFPSGASSSVQPGAVGNGGDVQITTGTLEVTDGAQLFASTFGEGSAGNVIITARDRALFRGTSADGRTRSAARSAVEPGGFGNGGDVQITAANLEVTDDAQLSASTFGQGSAGNVIITARDRALFRGRSAGGQFGSGAFSRVASGAIGNGGDVQITTANLEVTDGAQLTASTFGQGSAGNIILTTPRLTLHDQGRLDARSDTVDGGNIILNIGDLLLMRQNSQISATAGTARTERSEGNGGNITINSPNGFIVGVLRENSDITANAFTGNGGNITITAQGIYGLQFQPRLTPTSDITASSEFGFSGTVTLNIPDTDPSKGFLQLPVDLSDPTTRLDTRCQPGSRGYASSYIETGRSGIPASPDDLLTADPALPPWVIPPSHPHSPTNSASHHPSTPPNPLTDEANTLLRAPDGSIHLVRARALSPADFWRSPDCAFGHRVGG